MQNAVVKTKAKEAYASKNSGSFKIYLHRDNLN